MSNFHQSDSRFAEIMEGKARRRDKLMNAIREADSAVLAEPPNVSGKRCARKNRASGAGG